MVTIPEISPPLPRDFGWRRNLPNLAGLDWLRAGWADFKDQPVLSLIYGFGVFGVSLATVYGFFRLDMDYVLLPALAGFLVVGPILGLGLYEKSRRLALGQPVGLFSMIFARPRAGGQVIFAGLLLCLVMLLWMRAAVILYALFFGLQPFPGLDAVTATLFTTASGWGLIIVGTVVGGLFAAFSFAISVFAIPMLLNERIDALTAMGTSMALVWNNMSVMIVWGAVVVALMTVGVVTALLGLIVIFPILGHATWHAYKTMRGDPTAARTIQALDGAEA
ncbi:DUF2189 domain-containing protein [Oceanibacterium hippocampi]|uniref:DUF2189 domain-containing protein n=1 Tax=Oceanibacterium hippocampi TaxID=745714 RepID=A0A1Y5SF47_9PROT|nr:DUF2189 domain-containing protein [Oceanibacterium hippocampi]SLN36276.1 hypothetical protein OCH7691_01458 [Oceanibacterium hippocampi]